MGMSVVTVSNDDRIQAEFMRGVIKAEKKKQFLEMRRLKNQEHKALRSSSQCGGEITTNNGRRWQRRDVK